MKLAKSLALAAALVPTGAFADTEAANNPVPTFTASILGIGINVTDLGKSLEFYKDGIGMNLLGDHDLPNAHETFLGFDGADSPMVILVSGPMAAAAAASHPVSFGRIVFQADDLAALQSRLRAAGFPAGNARAIGGGIEVLIITDPDGYRMEFVAGVRTKG